MIDNKPRVAVFVYNTSKIGGPTKAMRLLMESWLKEHYTFKEFAINSKLGKIPRIKLILKLRKELRDFDPEIIHITGLQLHGFYAALISRLAGYKNLVLVVRGSSTDSLSFPLLNKALFKYIIEPYTIKLVRFVYTVCETMAEKKMIKESGKFVGVINNAIPLIDISVFTKGYVRNELGIGPSEVLFVYTGRITYEKGLDFALEAFNNIKNAKFLLCGTGENIADYKIKHKKLIDEKKVFFLGERQDVLNILFDADVFLFPTLHENLSNSLLEACVFGIPSIATSVGGNPEVIKNGFNGVLINKSDSIAIEKAANFFIENENERKIMGQNARNFVLEFFSQESKFKQVKEIYDKLARRDNMQDR